MDGLLEVATMKETEILVTVVVGMIGIRPTIEVIKAGKDIALANKETLVTADISICRQKDGSVYSSVDSELQCNLPALQWSRLLRADISRSFRKKSKTDGDRWKMTERSTGHRDKNTIDSR